MMLNVYATELYVKLSELSEITQSDIDRVYSSYTGEMFDELYSMLLFVIINPTESVDDDIVKSYISDIVDKIQISSGNKYSNDLKNAVIDYYILSRKRHCEPLDNIINMSLEFINNYTNSSGLVWFLVEDIKRQLLKVYITDYKYFDKLKSLIEELKLTEQEYRDYRCKF